MHNLSFVSITIFNIHVKYISKMYRYIEIKESRGTIKAFNNEINSSPRRGGGDGDT